MVYGLEVKKIPLIRGVGVFAKASFTKGDVVIRYAGETISPLEARFREAQQAAVRCSSIPF